MKAIAKAAGLADWGVLQRPQRGASAWLGVWSGTAPPTHEIERQGRWKEGGGMVGRYTRGEIGGSALRYVVIQWVLIGWLLSGYSTATKPAIG